MGTFLGRAGFNWWVGVVENRMDPLNLGRCQVRFFGHHPELRSELQTMDLPWATPSISVDSTTFMTSLKEGDWVWGFFMDTEGAQKPVICGMLPGINKDAADPEKGFCDGRTNLDEVPLPAEMRPPKTKPVGVSITRIRKIVQELDPPAEISTALNRVIDMMFGTETSVGLEQIPQAISKVLDMISELEGEVKSLIEKAVQWLLKNVQTLISKISLDLFLDEDSEISDAKSDPNSLPGSSTGFGVLMKDFDISYFDKNGDGQFNLEDAKLFIQECLSKSGYFTGEASNMIASVAPSSYPHTDKLNEPSTSRLARAENIEQTIVGRKNATLGVVEGAGHNPESETAQSSGISIKQPKSFYAAVPPYNKVQESESGHVIEVDDTPNHERLHWYHRAGTFTEIGPDGTEVNKVVKVQYNFIVEDYCLGVGKTINVEAADAIRIKSGKDMNKQIGSNLNIECGDAYHLGVGKGAYVYAKDGVVYIKANGNISLEAAGDEGVVEIKATKNIALSAPSIHLQGHGGAQADNINLVSPNIKATLLKAHEAVLLGTPPLPADGIKGVENDADKKTETSDSPKDGWLWPTGLFEELWKPESDSDKKLVTLGYDQTPHQIYEAVPIGVLEAVQIKYMDAGGKVSTWEVVRMKHVPGRLIDVSTMIKKFEGDARFLQRWKKPGGAYPTVCFLKTGTGFHLIIKSSDRHWFKFPFNEQIPMTPA